MAVETKTPDPLMQKIDGRKLGMIQTGGETHEKPDDPPEELNAFEKMEKNVYVNLLKLWIKPNKIGPKGAPSTEQEDRNAFFKKIELQTLEFLRKFFEEDIPPEVANSMQAKYKDLSP